MKSMVEKQSHWYIGQYNGKFYVYGRSSWWNRNLVSEINRF